MNLNSVRGPMLILILCVGQVGCTTIKGWFGVGGNEGEEPIEETVKNVRPASNKELELKLAKLWARVDEQGTQIRKQHEMIRVLEKGLLLGVIPEELKIDAEKSLHGDDHTHHEPEKDPVMLEKPGKMMTEEPQAMVAREKKESPPEDRSALKAQAQEHFEQGRYGKAIALYSQLDGGEDQSHRYWIALSWFRLKEYDTAQKEFLSFIQNNKDNPWVARAHYNLARVEYALGYQERAMESLRKVISTYPEEDAAQMARATIKKWEKSI